ncbi:unnamed protein product [Sphagnum troendelagicum]
MPSGLQEGHCSHVDLRRQGTRRTTGALTTTAAKTPKFPSEVVDKTVEQIEKSLESMEDEAERIYRDEQLSLVEDEAAATRDMMYVQVEFVDGGEN